MQLVGLVVQLTVGFGPVDIEPVDQPAAHLGELVRPVLAGPVGQLSLRGGPDVG